MLTTTHVVEEKKNWKSPPPGERRGWDGAVWEAGQGAAGGDGEVQAAPHRPGGEDQERSLSPLVPRLCRVKLMLNKCDQFSRSNRPNIVWIFLLLIRHQTEINHCPSQKGKSHVLGTWILLMKIINRYFWCCCWGYCWVVDNFFLIQVQVYFVDVHCVFLAQKRWSTEEVKWKKN